MSMLLSMIIFQYLSDLHDGLAYVPIPLLYQVSCSLLFSSRLYSSMTFVFCSDSWYREHVRAFTPITYHFSELVRSAIEVNYQIPSIWIVDIVTADLVR